MINNLRSNSIIVPESLAHEHTNISENLSFSEHTTINFHFFTIFFTLVRKWICHLIICMSGAVTLQFFFFVTARVAITSNRIITKQYTQLEKLTLEVTK